MHIFKAISLISVAAFASLAIATPTPVKAEAAVVKRQASSTAQFMVALENVNITAAIFSQNMGFLTQANATASNVAAVAGPLQVSIRTFLAIAAKIDGADLSDVIDDILNLVTDIISFIFTAISAVVDLVTDPSAVTAALQTLIGLVINFIVSLVALVPDLLGAIIGLVGQIVTQLLQIAPQLLQTLLGALAGILGGLGGL